MLTKTVRAETMILALEAIKKELGPDAQVVSARQVLSGPAWMVWKKNLFEVVAVKPESKNTITPVLMSPSLPEIEEMPQPVQAGALKYRQNLLQRTYQVGGVNPSAGEEKAAPVMDEPVGANQRSSPLINQESDFGILLKTLETVKLSKDIRLSSVNANPATDQNNFATENGNGIRAFSPALQELYQQLSRQGLETAMLFRLCKTCADSMPEKSLADKNKVKDYIRKQLIAGIKQVKESAHAIPPILYVVGTSGVGKTSVCAKLAVRLISEYKLKVGWVCADTVRVAALGEARTFSEAIGLPMNVAYSPDEMAEAVNNFDTKRDCTLIDTPAFNPRNEASMVQLGNLLTIFPHRATWLVVSATSKEEDLQNSLAALGPFKPRGLILTKLDETDHFGAAYNLAWRNQQQFIYFSSGNRVVNDLQPATPEALVDALFEERFQI